ncbi:prealbumin-like fold domain-containing protein [Actinomyces sp. B33]|nr:prealbumin-like fold domain-containing protein [Actinomyces sp. B33]
MTNALRAFPLTWRKTDEAGRPLGGAQWTLIRVGADDAAIDVPASADGSYTVEGLPMGDYSLTETAAPVGYRRLAEPLTIRIDADGRVAGLPPNGGIANEKAAAPLLPLTGGIGGEHLIIATALLGGLALGADLVRRRRAGTRND